MLTLQTFPWTIKCLFWIFKSRSPISRFSTPREWLRTFLIFSKNTKVSWISGFSNKVPIFLLDPLFRNLLLAHVLSAYRLHSKSWSSIYDRGGCEAETLFPKHRILVTANIERSVILLFYSVNLIYEQFIFKVILENGERNKYTFYNQLQFLQNMNYGNCINYKIKILFFIFHIFQNLECILTLLVYFVQ